MSHYRRTLALLLISGTLPTTGWAQTPPPAPPAPVQREVRRPTYNPATAPATAAIQRRSVVHHYPYPYPSYYNDDRTAGFRNPGGVGRRAEWYPAGNEFQVQGDPVRVASFDRGGGPNWDEQRAAQQVGIQRYNSIQQHIDNYARPYLGYGYGVGYFGGFY